MMKGMQMTDDLGPWLFGAGVLIFFGSFVVGMQWNIRKGHRVLRWLQDGLPLVGEKSTLRWLGSSVVELKIAKAKDPFRNSETLVVFEPRDVFVLWAYYRSRGRRDLLIFRSQLRTAPKFELEAFDPRAWTTHDIARNVQKKNWAQLALSANAVPPLAYYSGGDAAAARALIDLASQTGSKLVRLSVHRDVPNLEVHWQLPDMNTQSARDLFAKLRELAEGAMRG
ncbi:MAG: hypothetical protein KGJ80_03415 [Chloroflexota bacterium]|nr:hypothetical protein [Chloroflexota bacterium]